jgi:hypothetical protein
MMVIWTKHVVPITSEEQKRNYCVDGPIIALLTGKMFPDFLLWSVFGERVTCRVHAPRRGKKSMKSGNVHVKSKVNPMKPTVTCLVCESYKYFSYFLWPSFLKSWIYTMFRKHGILKGKSIQCISRLKEILSCRVWGSHSRSSED